MGEVIDIGTISENGLRTAAVQEIGVAKYFIFVQWTQDSGDLVRIF
jgi:hypothetical protein